MASKAASQTFVHVVPQGGQGRPTAAARHRDRERQTMKVDGYDIGKREAAITAWYGDDMETTTLFNLTVA
jgi:hypothetical protein